MNVGLVNKPKSGLTLRVWQLADEISEKAGRLARRREVIEAFTAEGGNEGTASTQYYYWKSAHLDNTGETAAIEDSAADEDAAFEGALQIRVSNDGAIKLPSEFLQCLGVEKGGLISARMDGGELRISTPASALDKVRTILEPLRKKLSDEGISLSDELIADRRLEAKTEGEV